MGPAGPEGVDAAEPSGFFLSGPLIPVRKSLLAETLQGTLRSSRAGTQTTGTGQGMQSQGEMLQGFAIAGTLGVESSGAQSLGMQRGPKLCGHRTHQKRVNWIMWMM